MAIKWYLVPEFTYPSGSKHEAEIGSYEVSGNLTDFPRGLFLAYGNKGLVTGLGSRREAELWRDEGKYDLKTDTWSEIPSRERIAQGA